MLEQVVQSSPFSLAVFFYDFVFGIKRMTKKSFGFPYIWETHTTSFKITVILKASVKLDIFALYKLPLDKLHFARSITIHNLKVS